MSDAPPSSLLAWFADRQPERTHRAGSLVFVDIDAAGELLDRAEAAGVAVRRARGFVVARGIATPISGQTLAPEAGDLLDCETPSGATCGAVRRTLRRRWSADQAATGRHMVLLDFDDAGGCVGLDGSVD